MVIHLRNNTSSAANVDSLWYPHGLKLVASAWPHPTPIPNSNWCILTPTSNENLTKTASKNYRNLPKTNMYQKTVAEHQKLLKTGPFKLPVQATHSSNSAITPF